MKLVFKKIIIFKKPLVIIGDSVLELKSGKYIFEEFKKYLNKNNFINKDWNSLNFLPTNAATVGLIDLQLISKENEEKIIFLKNWKTMSLNYCIYWDQII